MDIGGRLGIGRFYPKVKCGIIARKNTQFSDNARRAISLTSGEGPGASATCISDACARWRRAASNARQLLNAVVIREATCGLFGSSARMRSATNS